MTKPTCTLAHLHVRLIESPRPSPGPDEILVAVARVGICGSDLHAYHGRHPFIQLPVVPGHEFAGAVVEVGANVHDFVPGQRVTVEPSLVCGVCHNCTRGRYNICERLRVIGCQTTGALGEYLAVPASKTLLLPDSVTWDQAVMVEPLAVAVHAVRLARFQSVQPGANVLILGAGTIGLMRRRLCRGPQHDRSRPGAGASLRAAAGRRHPRVCGRCRHRP